MNFEKVKYSLLTTAAYTKAFSSDRKKQTRKRAVRTFIQSQYLKALAASLRVGFCNEWKRGFTVHTNNETVL